MTFSHGLTNSSFIPGKRDRQLHEFIRQADSDRTWKVHLQYRNFHQSSNVDFFHLRRPSRKEGLLWQNSLSKMPFKRAKSHGEMAYQLLKHCSSSAWLFRRMILMCLNFILHSLHSFAHMPKALTEFIFICENGTFWSATNYGYIYDANGYPHT